MSIAFRPSRGAAAAILTAAYMLAGCSSDYRVTPVVNTERASTVEWLADKRGSVIADLGESEVLVLNPYTYGPNQDSPKDRISPSSSTSQFSTTGKRPLYDVATDPDETMAVRQMARNELINAIIRVSDANAATHLAGLKATQANLNVFLGAAALGLSGAGAAIEGGSQALAAASTGVQGTRTLINDEVYSQALAESIITLIKADRQSQAEAIRKRYTEDLLSFPVEEGIAIASSYHETASVYNGLALARQAIERDAIRKRGEEPDRLSSLPESVAAAERDLEKVRKKLKDTSAALDATTAELAEVVKQVDAETDQAAKAKLTKRKQTLEQEKARLTAAKPALERIVKDQELELANRKKSLREQLDADIKVLETPKAGAKDTPTGVATPTPAGAVEKAKNDF